MKYRIREQNELKSSGVEWLGDIPKDWEISRISNLFTTRSEKVSDKEFEALSVTKKGIVKQLENVAKTDNGDNRKKVLKNDFVINSRADRKGSCGISPFDGSVSLISHVLTPNKDIYPLYANYLFRNYYFSEEFYRWGTGIVADLWSTNIERMKKISVPFINTIEQQKIANFLDEKSKIFDESISKKEQLISKLELAKQSLISEVVTGKLKIIENNSKLQTIKREQNELKSSGVECLGDIPKEWEIKKFKYIIKLNPNKFNLDEKIKNDIEVSFVPMENVRRGNINLDNIKNINSVMSGYTFFEEDDILIAKVTPCFENHNCAIAKNLKNKIGFGSTELNVLRCFNKDSIKFVYYYVQTDLFINLGVSQMTGTGGLKRVPSSFFENFKISFPTITEQQKISKYLDEKLIHFDNTIEKTKQSIKKLKLAKEALISQAVTGKIEVL